MSDSVAEHQAPSGSPTSLLGKVRGDLQSRSDECRLKSLQIEELERQIKSLTQCLHAARDTEQKQAIENRAALSHLEERSLTERREVEHELCRVQHQLRCSEAAAASSQQQIEQLSTLLRTLQMEKVSVEQRVRELETEVATRRRLLDSATEQLVRFKQTAAQLAGEPEQLRQWLQRLEHQQTALIDTQRKLELHVQYQNQRLRQLTATNSGAGDTETVTAVSTHCVDQLSDIIRDKDAIIASLRVQLASQKHTAVVSPFTSADDGVNVILDCVQKTTANTETTPDLTPAQHSASNTQMSSNIAEMV